MNYLYILTIDNCRPFLEKIETPYNLLPAPLPVPQVTHVYAEDRLVYKLVKMKNKTCGRP